MIDKEYEYEKIDMLEIEGSVDFLASPYRGNLYTCYGGEDVMIDIRKFNLDTGILELNISKVLYETDVNKEKAEIELDAYIAAFNEDMICSNETLKNYCDVHGLIPKETDVLKLWKIVFPKNDFNIMDGKMVKVPNPGNDCLNSNSKSYYISANELSSNPLYNTTVVSGTAINF